MSSVDANISLTFGQVKFEYCYKMLDEVNKIIRINPPPLRWLGYKRIQVVGKGREENR